MTPRKNIEPRLGGSKKIPEDGTTKASTKQLFKEPENTDKSDYNKYLTGEDVVIE